MALQDTAHKKPRGLSAAIPVLYPNENWLYSIARTKTKALLEILILPSSMILTNFFLSQQNYTSSSYKSLVKCKEDTTHNCPSNFTQIYYKILSTTRI